MIVIFKVLGNNDWYFLKVSDTKDWKFSEFADATLGYICGYKSVQDAETGNEDDGVWHRGEYVVSFKEFK